MKFLSLYIARKLSLSDENGSKMSPAVKVAAIAVGLSVMVMLCALAIVSGFKREIREKVTGFNSHITLLPSEMEKSGLVSLSNSVRHFLDAQSYVSDYSLEFSVPVIFKTNDNFKGVYLRGLEPDSREMRFISENTRCVGPQSGIKDEREVNSVVISRLAASQLGLEEGDTIDTYFLTENVKVRRLRISGIYESWFDNYDDLFAYTTLAALQRTVGNIPADRGSQVHVRVNDFDSVEYYRERLEHELSVENLAPDISVTDARQQGASYFQWLDLLDTNVVIIIILMSLVSVVTMISGMLLIMTDKIRVIGLLKALGASDVLIRKVFVNIAVKVSFWGLVSGNVIGLALLFAQKQWHIISLDPESYYIDFVPVQINWMAVGMLDISVVVIIAMSLLLPSAYASRISPSETLRYE